jgi:hypothetical protein
MKNSVLAAMSIAMVATLGSVSASSAKTVDIDFALAPIGANISYVGSNLGTATSFNLDTPVFYIVQAINAGDQSGLSLGSLAVTITGNKVIDLTVGATTNLVKAWGGYTETLTSVVKIVRGTDSLSVYLSGVLNGNGVTNEAVDLILSANQAGGPGSSIGETITNTTVTVAVPELSTWGMMLSGFAAIGFAGYRRKSVSFAA